MVGAAISCDRCLQPLDPELAHWDHKDDCGRHHHSAQALCDCDLSVHPACCKSCLPAHKNPRAS